MIVFLGIMTNEMFSMGSQRPTDFLFPSPGRSAHSLSVSLTSIQCPRSKVPTWHVGGENCAGGDHIPEQSLELCYGESREEEEGLPRLPPPPPSGVRATSETAGEVNLCADGCVSLLNFLE